MLKIWLNGEIAELKEGLELILPQLNIKIEKDGIPVNVRHGDKLSVKVNDKEGSIVYSKRVEFFRALSTEYIRLYDGTREMLMRLRESGKKIYLLSNAQRIFTEYEMNALGITKYFDKIYISSDCGCKKPDLSFFEKLISECGVDKRRAVMVGNDGICDILGAKRAGLAALYVRSNISPEEELPAADHVLPAMDMKEISRILLGETC